MNSDPSTNMIEDESNHLFLCFCTFVMNLKGKKLSTQNVFVQVLQSEKLKTIFKDVLNLDTDFELVRTFLEFDPSIAKSKYVTKWIRIGKSKKGKSQSGKNIQRKLKKN